VISLPKILKIITFFGTYSEQASFEKLPKGAYFRNLSNRFHMITTLIFDMDGVLVDSEPIHKRVEQDLYNELGLKVSYEEHMSMVGMSSKNTWTMLRQKYGFAPSVEEMVQAKKRNYRQILIHTDEIPLMKGVIPVLEKLVQNHTLGVASSSSLDNIRTVLNKYKLKKFFQHRTSGQEVAFSKPNPDIFLLAAKRANALPQNCLVVEDSRNGVKAAKAAGMKCIGFQNPNSGTQDLSPADAIVDNYAEFESAFQVISTKNG